MSRAALGGCLASCNSLASSVRQCAPRLHLSRRWLAASHMHRRVSTLEPRRDEPCSTPATVQPDTLKTDAFRTDALETDALKTNAFKTDALKTVDALHEDSNHADAGLAFAASASCPGCGAPAQTLEHDAPGFFNVRRRAVRDYLLPGAVSVEQPLSPEDTVYQTAIDRASSSLLASVGSSRDAASPPAPKAQDMPLCDRCHDLLHHHRGVSIHHPSLESLEQTIADSPYTHNHIYHVLDAADFPMSLVPNIQRVLEASPQRSKNRRAKHATWKHGRKTEMSFIITRSDLLAPKKSQVDRLMPYLADVLRDALGRAGRNVRLGNVHCVSAKRGWWTREVKENIWRRGGAGWMVGKVNVGKSNLFEVAFPKGHAEDINFDAVRSAARRLQPHDADQEDTIPNVKAQEDGIDDEDSLLPPARQEVPFPTMPTVSSLPGTTASPIRIPFGNGKGELIDLPGLARGDLEKYVRPEHREALVMRARVSPQQHTIKQGKSLLIGGLIRICSVDHDLDILAYPFVPLKPHLTSTQKALDMASGEKAIPDSFVANTSVTAALQSAGRFALKWDVTKARAGPLTTRAAVNLKEDNLAFRVLSADIVIESLGWVELVIQVRRRQHDQLLARSESMSEETDATGEQRPKQSPYPEVEVFSPEGKFVSVRRPMGAWLLSNKAPLPVSQRRARPRKSMAGRRG